VSLESESSADGSEDRELLTAERDLLRGENERLRRALSEARRTRHRRATVVLAVFGVIAFLGAVVLPTERTLLLAVGSTGLFAAVLTRFLTTERFVSADIGERVYEGCVTDHESIIAELGLRDERVYVPSPETGRVRLFVPQHVEYAVPLDTELESTFVVTDEPHRRGVTFTPTGQGLLSELTSMLRGGPSDDPRLLGEQLADGVVESFELARSATADVDSAEGRATITVVDGTYGSIDRFDHPIASLFGVAFASVLDEPVIIEGYSDEESDREFVTCRWNGESATDEG
jgi:hypothetical protein